jgi:putative phosphoribosyl transferase
MTTLVRRSEVAVGSRRLGGALELPDNPSGLVLFAHGSGSSRYSPRNTFVAEALLARGFATLLMDLLTRNEARDRRNVFDIPLLAGRVVEAIDWIAAEPALATLPIGLFGASTGAAAALVAAAQRPERIGAVVSRGGRPDLAGEDLARVAAPTLLIVGALDYEVLELNRQSQGLLPDSRLEVVPGATHLFEEPGTLERVVELAADWFAEKLRRRGEG